MQEHTWHTKFCKLFGLVYAGFNVLIIAVVVIMVIGTAGNDVRLFPRPIFFIVPAIGILSGYWIHKLRFGWWRSLVIVLSLLCSVAFLFISVVPGLPAETLNQEQSITSREVESKNVQQFFDGVYSEDIAIIKEQLNNGVDVNAVNDTQQTALHVTQNTDVARLLIESGGDIHAKDDAGMTPVFNKAIEIAAMLLDAGANINAGSEKGNTPFTWYAYSGYLDGLRFLVSRGADVNACNADNQNALDIAKHFHPNSDVLEYLQMLDIQSCQ